MTVAAIKEKIHLFIENASDEKVKAVYSMIENDLGENASNGYSEEFMMELDRRIHEHNHGISKPISADESKKRIRKILDSRK